MEQFNQNEETKDQIWVCPKCNENNLASDRYCKKCGFDAFSPVKAVGAVEKGGVGKIILISASILIFLGILATVGFFWYTNNQNNAAKNYLTLELESFKKVVVSINELSTESDLKDKDNNLKLFVKKLEDEKIKSEKSLNEIKNAKDSNNKAVVNKLVLGVDSLFKDFYKDVEGKAKRYDEYINYEINFLNNINYTIDELDKLDTVFKGAKNDKDFLNALKAEKKIVDDAVVKHKELVSPSGMEEVQKKEVGYYEKLSSLLNNLIISFEAKSVQGVVNATNDLVDFYADKKIFEEIDQLTDYHFGKIHDDFIESRIKADNVKNELIKAGVEFNLEVRDLNIEGW